MEEEEEKERSVNTLSKRKKYEGMRHSVPNGSTPTRDSALTVARSFGWLAVTLLYSAINYRQECAVRGDIVWLIP